MKKIILILLFLFLSVSTCAAVPAINFTDIINGPDTGIGDGLGSGTIVTVWGNRLGSIQGGSKVYFEDSLSVVREVAHYYYWQDADGSLPGGPSDLSTRHEMQEIAFSIPDSEPGAGTIYVVVDGETSNTLPFTVRTGSIFYLSSTGSGSNDGSFASPWAAMNATTPLSACLQATFVAGSVIYAKDQMTETGAVSLRYKAGTETEPFVLSSYPGGRYQTTGALSNSFPYDHPWWVISKTFITSNTNGISIGGAWDCIGNEVTDNTCADGQGGAISANSTTGLASNPRKNRILGNYIHDFGCLTTISKHHVFYISNRGKNYVKDGSNNVWACTADHTASSDNEPPTGPNYLDYWEAANGNANPTFIDLWVDTTVYDDGKIWGYELGWNYVKDCQARNALHIYDEANCGDYFGTIDVHHNWVENQAGAGLAIGTLGAYVDSPCISAPINTYNNILVGAGQAPFDDLGSVYIYGQRLTSVVSVDNTTVYGQANEGSSSTDNYVTVPDGTWSTDFQFGGVWNFRNNALYDTTGATWDDPSNGNKTPAASTNTSWYRTTPPVSPPAWDDVPTQLTADPEFTNAGALDFTPQSTSPLIGAGTVLDSLFTDDFLTTVRVAVPWTIGALTVEAAVPITETTVTLPADYTDTSPSSYQGTAQAPDGETISTVISSNGYTVTIDSGAGTQNVAFTVTGVLPTITDTITATSSDASTGFEGITITLSVTPTTSGGIRGGEVRANFR